MKSTDWPFYLLLPRSISFRLSWSELSEAAPLSFRRWVASAHGVSLRDLWYLYSRGGRHFSRIYQSISNLRTWSIVIHHLDPSYWPWQAGDLTFVMKSYRDGLFSKKTIEQQPNGRRQQGTNGLVAGGVNDGKKPVKIKIKGYILEMKQYYVTSEKYWP